MPKPEIPQIAVWILTYLVNNPHAEDTIEGIVHWWVLEQRIQQTMNEVENALGMLLAHDFLVIERGPDARVHYRINSEKYTEIEDFLKTIGSQ